DEGPGLSGSSFGSVADWLEERGIPLERIAFICSHAGEPGPEAPVRHRRRWSRVQRSAASFGAELADVVRPWVEERMGSPVTSIADISGGVWRKLQQLDVGEWPAANPALERRKFLLRVNGNQLVARFAGLGEEGERKLQIARELHRLGYGPAPIDLIHGFVVEEWHGDARPVDAGAISAGELSRYIAARAALPLPRPGATLEDLHRMLCRNAELLLGQGAATAADRWRPLLQRLQQRVVPACTDNRLDRCEWLRRTDGSLIKMDAVDHHAAHDLIGCQDLAWDVVGAAVEFELDDAQTQSLASLTAAAAGRAVDAKLLEYLHLAYLAFRGGQAAMARNMTCSADEVRWLARQRSYAKRLNQGLLEERNSATRGFA
ncbi:MAG: hypothetical protein ACJ8EY_06750, partial [Sphingomicrobium sp.]